ncbi:MAG: DUF927 domain-containing protein [Polaromonas sp.]|uniref:DUF927 domain-containing protein n=1 Tax=Polaromonas sp. TaxID=1869339 RepID=UPI00271EC7E7|nr:DUF927 domain-containing protein [Polaromonas sp.]MDO9114974.1 DUF927 domain-containing protein [Polaromonas sp.]MDP1885562.1 DUF927 domain-containing protein [Polaromonas sp.]
MNLKKLKKKLLKQHNLHMDEKGLHYGEGPDAVRLMRAFKVLALCRATDGGILGVALGNNGRKCLVPMAAFRDPRKLADYLETIGLVAPSDLKELKLVAKYVDKFARRLPRIAILSEGIHRVRHRGTDMFLAVIAGVVHGAGGLKVIPVLNARSVYASSGTLSEWNDVFLPMMAKNPLMLLSVCFALSAPLAVVLDFKPMGILIAGPSSTGKTTLGKLVESCFQYPGDPHQWSATGNGMEALAVIYRDLPLVIDELGSGDAGAALAAIYRLSGGVTKARATRTGALQASEVMRSPIFATGEVTLQNHANQAGVAMRAGHEARMPTIQVDESYGVFSDIGKAADGAEFAAQVTVAMKAQYGTIMPAFIEAVLADVGKMQRRAAKIRKNCEAELAGCDLITLSGLEKRVLDGFVNYAVAGELAIRFKVLSLDRHVAIEAVGHIYQQWLKRWRASSNNVFDAPVTCLRSALKEVMNDFVPLKDWKDKGRKGTPGYTKTMPKEGNLFLLHRHVFERMCGPHGVEATVAALRHHGLLVTDKKAQVKLFRMPGREAGKDGDRMAFYAVREAILFDQ